MVYGELKSITFLSHKQAYGKKFLSSRGLLIAHIYCTSTKDASFNNYPSQQSLLNEVDKFILLKEIG